MSTTNTAVNDSLTGTTGARPGAMGFLTDTTLCIGCKACEVACKQWNQLPMDGFGWTGFSYDNTGDLGATTWRHVAFIERITTSSPALPQQGEVGRRPTSLKPFQSNWLMQSDVCKHCVNAGCLQACPTGAIIRTEFDTVVIQQDICNGCGYCVPACPFGVPELSPIDGKAHKCTLCYDRVKDGLEPACAKSCPTDSIQFGLVEELMERAKNRVAALHERGVNEAYIYGDRAIGGTGGMEGLNAFFILTAPAEVYNLPACPTLPQDRAWPAFLATAGAAVAFGLAALFALKEP
ncbi:MAG: 4Fe-4S dicluster domain-containing protein [Ardenticatenaceae bacterium]|nr:4Fe-4S dicluster domain-containing protein [Ardenticatenaceae bacterium]HBY96878.1 4Fe-4S ferredoxin [Chloroflexota bacterium]